MRVFLDANILFSAAKSDGAIRELLKRLQKGRHLLLSSDYAIEEARRNIAAKYPETATELEALLTTVEQIPSAQMPAGLSVQLPEKDEVILGAAICGHCDLLVTGDRRHFGEYYGKTFANVTVLAPSMVVSYL